MIGQQQPIAQLLRLPDVMRLTGLSRTTLYRLIDKGQFPRQINISVRAVAWRASEVEAWIHSRSPGQAENSESEQQAIAAAEQMAS
jgi:prophage regulatory protein